MYFIEKGEDLIGKTIAFIHCAQFAEAITIATTDGGLMVAKQDDDGDSSEIRIYKSHSVQQYLFEKDGQKWLVEELKKLGVIGGDDYDKLREARRLAREESDRKQKERHEKHEREEYLRLKEKYREEQS
ncbi:conserved hypothetical protein [Candidatus Desulfosporosinus infrequens]|uniref:Uncharacterized protein n=1 Tax=Candidatus Desulfosporosinus infrequens TaxID=2043169 RepID=A0A2U3LH43_9FIRM|nr:conserved hypothetical protein [Candidatus Desulfosporosinus infrequens]